MVQPGQAPNSAPAEFQFQNVNARVKIAGRQMRIAHGHLQRLVAEPHLHAPHVDATLDEARSAGMAQNMRHNLCVVPKPHLGLGLVPHGAKLCGADHGEGTGMTIALNLHHILRALGQRHRAAAGRFGDPETRTSAQNIVPGKTQRFAEAATCIDKEDGKTPGILAFRANSLEQTLFFFGCILQQPDLRQLVIQSSGSGMHFGNSEGVSIGHVGRELRQSMERQDRAVDFSQI